MAKRFCCPECFGDRALRDQIFPSLNPHYGRCDFCEADGVPLLKPEKLSEYFELLVNAYKPDENGKSLVEWMKGDWQLFDRMDIFRAKDLLREILNNGQIVRRNFKPSANHVSRGLAQWDKLRGEMMYSNRWFFEPIDLDRLGELLDMLIASSPLPQIWYRARICRIDKVFPIEEMGAPPKGHTSHGRANPAGIPYLYLGSTPETAIAEIRPHTGENASVADFRIVSPEIKAVDLRNPRKFVSPFILSDADDVGQLLADLPLLERLGEELTKPVLPTGAAIDYISSQYLCEFIKKRGFDGVVYRSSVGDGFNLALFDPKKAVARSVMRYEVTKVSVEIAAANKSYNYTSGQY